MSVSGIIYAPSALLTMSGNGNLQNTLVVNELNISRNVNLAQLAMGSDSTADNVGIANTLLAGDLNVYVNDPGGYFSTDMLSRIEDAITAWDALLSPYSVTISEVSDPGEANLTIDDGNTSANGGMSDGVLGCYNATNSEITILQGWSWYAGADATQIGAGQYDFQTTISHELGHALGLGHSSSDTSPMNGTLPTGTARRFMTVQDLNIPDPPGGADPLTAARVPSVEQSTSGVNVSGSESAQGMGRDLNRNEHASSTMRLGSANDVFRNAVPLELSMQNPNLVLSGTGEAGFFVSPGPASRPLVGLGHQIAVNDQLFVQFRDGRRGGGARLALGRAERGNTTETRATISAARQAALDGLLAEWGPTDENLSIHFARETFDDSVVDNLVLDSRTKGLNVAGTTIAALWATGWSLTDAREEAPKKRQSARAWSLQK
jgi:hypothetical protein